MCWGPVAARSLSLCSALPARAARVKTPGANFQPQKINKKKGEAFEASLGKQARRLGCFLFPGKEEKAICGTAQGHLERDEVCEAASRTPPCLAQAGMQEAWTESVSLGLEQPAHGRPYSASESRKRCLRGGEASFQPWQKFSLRAVPSSAYREPAGRPGSAEAWGAGDSRCGEQCPCMGIQQGLMGDKRVTRDQEQTLHRWSNQETTSKPRRGNNVHLLHKVQVALSTGLEEGWRVKFARGGRSSQVQASNARGRHQKSTEIASRTDRCTCVKS